MNDSELNASVKASMTGPPLMKITIACPICKERMETLESPVMREVACRSCSHEITVRGRKIVLKKKKYCYCRYCKSLVLGPKYPPCCQRYVDWDRMEMSFIERVEKYYEQAEAGEITKEECEKKGMELRRRMGVESEPWFYPENDIELDLPPQPQNMEQEIIEILRKGLSPGELQLQIAAVTKKYAPPAPPPPPRPDVAREMQADIAAVIQEGRRVGKSQHEINAEIEYIKQQYAKK